MTTSPRNPAVCPRCQGRMVYERFQDMLDLFYAWRCLNCGQIVEPERDAKAARKGKPGRPRTPGRGR